MKTSKKKTVLTTEQKRDKYLLKKYGVGIEYYNKKFEEQNGVCAICKHPPKPGKNLCLDHNHETGEARGLLDFKCNKLTLGRLEHGSKTPRKLLEGLVEYAVKYRLKGDPL